MSFSLTEMKFVVPVLVMILCLLGKLSQILSRRPFWTVANCIAYGPLKTREYIPEWFTLVATLSQCTHDGRYYYDKANDFSLEIPEGAIPEGESITIDIGVALYGPFQYPKGLKPVSPVFWLCVRDRKFFCFLKPVTVTIPHFLDLENHDVIKSLGLNFLKGDHELRLQKLQKVEGQLLVEPLKTFGVLQTTHFCCLCIAGNISQSLVAREVFCLSAVIPHTYISSQPSYAYFFVTYMLPTCLTTVKQQIEDNPDLQGHKVYFNKIQEFQFLEIVLPTSPPGWTMGLQSKTKVLVHAHVCKGCITNTGQN